MKPVLITSGEPAGIGPDLCLSLVNCPWPLVVLGDKALLQQRAQQLNLAINFIDYHRDSRVLPHAQQLTVLSLPTVAPVIAGELNVLNATYVIDLLSLAVKKCLQGEFSALVTAPVNKAIINQAGFSFSGHTEFLATLCGTNSVVMMLACDLMKVALVTTHLPLKNIAEVLTQSLLTKVILQVDQSLKQQFGIVDPRLFVAGLNPHAGEGGFLGREEIEIINPVLTKLRAQGLNVQGPFSADTLFTPASLQQCDAFISMYHDQGLPVLKYTSFGSAVNISLGLPIIRTSVDHGTALDLAATGKASNTSLLAAVRTAVTMAKNKELSCVLA